ncbi:MAG: hypothetical protein ACT4OZ_12275 [Gemmatimonadota bacterium]
MTAPHLAIERLAELVDGGVTSAEREHLVICTRCAGELDAYRRVVALASDERRRIAPPLSSWEKISDKLREEGLIVTPGGGAVTRYSRRVRAWSVRAAAAVLLIAAGVVSGRLSSGVTLGDAVPWRAFFTDSAVTSDGAATTVAASARFRSAEDALAQLEMAQNAYEEAAAFLSAQDTAVSGEVAEQYRTRLAALDRASRTFEAALTDAPRDPVLNQYFLATMNAREATMQRLGTALPVSSKLGRF